MKKLLLSLLVLFTLNGFKASAQVAIPNSDFERWTTLLGEQSPDGWFTMAMVGQSEGSVSRTNEAYHGQYALKLKSVEVEGESGETEIMQAFAITGKFNMIDYSMQLGFPYTERPNKLSFYYKYLPVTNDAMYIGVVLRKSVPGEEPIFIGQGIFSTGESTNQYTRGEVEIEYESDEMPDTAMIQIIAGQDTMYAGTELVIDYLNFEFAAGVEDQVAKAVDKALAVKAAYPQPASDKIYIPYTAQEAQTVSVQFTDMLGKTVSTTEQRSTVGSNLLTIPVNTWKPGIYIYKMTAGNKTQTGKIIVGK